MLMWTIPFNNPSAFSDQNYHTTPYGWLMIMLKMKGSYSTLLELFCETCIAAYTHITHSFPLMINNIKYFVLLYFVNDS